MLPIFECVTSCQAAPLVTNQQQARPATTALGLAGANLPWPWPVPIVFDCHKTNARQRHSGRSCLSFVSPSPLTKMRPLRFDNGRVHQTQTRPWLLARPTAYFDKRLKLQTPERLGRYGQCQAPADPSLRRVPSLVDANELCHGLQFADLQHMQSKLICQRHWGQSRPHTHLLATQSQHLAVPRHRHSGVANFQPSKPLSCPRSLPRHLFGTPAQSAFWRKHHEQHNEQAQEASPIFKVPSHFCAKSYQK